MPAVEYGFGATLYLSSGGAFTAVDELKVISLPDMERGEASATSHGSEDAFVEHLAALRQGGFSIEANYTSNGYAAFVTDYQSDVANEYMLSTPSGHYWIAEGFLTNLEIEPPIDGVMSIKASLKLSGEPQNSPFGALSASTPTNGGLLYYMGLL